MVCQKKTHHSSHFHICTQIGSFRDCITNWCSVCEKVGLSGKKDYPYISSNQAEADPWLELYRFLILGQLTSSACNKFNFCTYLMNFLTNIWVFMSKLPGSAEIICQPTLALTITALRVPLRYKRLANSPKHPKAWSFQAYYC